MGENKEEEEVVAVEWSVTVRGSGSVLVVGCGWNGWLGCTMAVK